MGVLYSKGTYILSIYMRVVGESLSSFYSYLKSKLSYCFEVVLL